MIIANGGGSIGKQCSSKMLRRNVFTAQAPDVTRMLNMITIHRSTIH